jgi:hypothetical protein
MIENSKRSLMKAISWRITGTLDAISKEPLQQERPYD